MRVCTMCHQEKPHYGKGLCRPCYGKHFRATHQGYYKAWWKDHPRTPEALRTARLRSRWEMTPADYDAMLASQGGVCAGCDATTPGGRFDRFAIDHDHRTGAIRGLLCVRCNRAIGLLRDDPALMRRLIDYLREAPGAEVPSAEVAQARAGR